MNPFESQLLLLRILLLLFVYGFLVSVLFFLWRDLQAAGRRAGEPRAAQRQLVVVESGDSGLSAGKAFPLEPVTAIGRDVSNTIVVPDVFASSRHAQLALRDSRWWLEDLGSRNGTFVNNQRIAGPTRVQAGDLIGIGRVVLRLEV